jgi:hypothetical protein
MPVLGKKILIVASRVFLATVFSLGFRFFELGFFVVGLTRFVAFLCCFFVSFDRFA